MKLWNGEKVFKGDGSTLIANAMQMKMLSFGKNSQVKNQKMAYSAMSSIA